MPSRALVKKFASLLVVDDDEMNRDMLSRRLRRHGYAVTVAEDGGQALALVAGQPFDLVVLDVMMPGIDGLHVLKTLRKTYSMADLPVIMATVRDQSEDVIQALQLGANDYVTKPLDFPLLLARVGAQLNLKQARRAIDGAVTPAGGADSAQTTAPEIDDGFGSTFVVPDSRDGQSIGRYHTVQRLGGGGMGEVYLARDPVLDRPLAIKLLREEFANERLRQRFGREARAAARLTHRNIVTIYDVGEHGGRPFIAMEFVPGETLADHVTRRTLSMEGKLLAMEALCDGLGHAHRAGIVHRDVKPANLMLTPDGQVKILDFGVARLVDVVQPGLTAVNTIVGTVNYMAPEQLLGEPVDHRADIFAAGAVFYELLAGQEAFPGSLESGVLRKVLAGTPDPLHLLCPGLDRPIIAIVHRALEKSKEDRYPDMETMRRDIVAARHRLGREGQPRLTGP